MDEKQKERWKGWKEEGMMKIENIERKGRNKKEGENTRKSKSG